MSTEARCDGCRKFKRSDDEKNGMIELLQKKLEKKSQRLEEVEKSREPPNMEERSLEELEKLYDDHQHSNMNSIRRLLDEEQKRGTDMNVKLMGRSAEIARLKLDNSKLKLKLDKQTAEAKRLANELFRSNTALKNEREQPSKGRKQEIKDAIDSFIKAANEARSKKFDCCAPMRRQLAEETEKRVTAEQRAEYLDTSLKTLSEEFEMFKPVVCGEGERQVAVVAPMTPVLDLKDCLKTSADMKKELADMKTAVRNRSQELKRDIESSEKRIESAVKVERKRAKIEIDELQRNNDYATAETKRARRRCEEMELKMNEMQQHYDEICVLFERLPSYALKNV